MKEQQLVMLFSLCILPIITAAVTEMTTTEKDCKCDEWMSSSKRSTTSSMLLTTLTQIIATNNASTATTKGVGTATTKGVGTATTKGVGTATTKGVGTATTKGVVTATTKGTGIATTKVVGTTTNIITKISTEPTTKSTKTTTTSPESNTTSPEFNTTSPEFNKTSPEFNTTSPEFNTTSPEINTTSPEFNTTSPEFNTTSPEFNTTSPEFNTASPESTTTSPEFNTTSPEFNTTSPESTTTSPEFNTTSPELNTTSPESTATSPKSSIHNRKTYPVSHHRGWRNSNQTGHITQNTTSYCDNVCRKYVAKTEQKYSLPTPQWSSSRLSVPMSIFVEGTFTEDLKKSNSDIYKHYTNVFQSNLRARYNDTPGLVSLTVTGFRAGSIICDYNVTMNLTTNSISDQYKSLLGVNLTEFAVKVGTKSLDIQLSKTNKAMQQYVRSFFLKECTCSSEHTACMEENEKFTCSHKCKVPRYNKCSKHGDCSVNERGKTECRCHEDSYYVYKGDTCQDKVLVFFSGRNTAIIGSCAGVLIAVILLLTIYLVARWRNKRIKKRSDENQSDPKELQRDNSRIENVPMGGVGRANPAYQSESSDRSNHYEPYPGDRSNHYEPYPGDRPVKENVYEEELAYNEGRYYRVLNDPESGTKAYVYQPSNISMPDKRTSTASKFDDLESKPPSYYLRPEKEQRPIHDNPDRDQRPFHDMADRDQRFFQNKADRQQHPYKDMADRDQRPFHGMADRDQRPIHNNVDRQQRPFQDMADRDHQPFHDMTDRENPYAIKRPQIMRSMVTSDGYR